MIAYEDLCRALDHYNRRLRGEEIPEEPAYAEMDAGYDVMETEDVGAEASPADALSADYGDGYPDVTAETELPAEGYEQQAYEQQAYEQQAYEQQAYDPNTGQPVEGMTPDQVSSGHQQAYGSGAYEQQGYATPPPTATPPPGYATPPPMPGTPPPEGHDPNRQ